MLSVKVPETAMAAPAVNRRFFDIQNEARKRMDEIDFFTVVAPFRLAHLTVIERIFAVPWLVQWLISRTRTCSNRA